MEFSKTTRCELKVIKETLEKNAPFYVPPDMMYMLKQLIKKSLNHYENLELQKFEKQFLISMRLGWVMDKKGVLHDVRDLIPGIVPIVNCLTEELVKHFYAIAVNSYWDSMMKDINKKFKKKEL